MKEELVTKAHSILSEIVYFRDTLKYLEENKFNIVLRNANDSEKSVIAIPYTDKEINQNIISHINLTFKAELERLEKELEQL